MIIFNTMWSFLIAAHINVILKFIVPYFFLSTISSFNSRKLLSFYAHNTIFIYKSPENTNNNAYDIFHI